MDDFMDENVKPNEIWNWLNAQLDNDASSRSQFIKKNIFEN